MRKILSLVLLLVLCIGLVTAVSAADDPVYLVDEAELLTAGERLSLEEKLQQLSQEYNTQIVVYTTDYTGGAGADRFVNQAYDSMDIGFGASKSGVLLMVAMDIREYRILSNGDAATAISGEDIDSISDMIVSDLSGGWYADAFDTFADECVYYLEGYSDGLTFDVGENLLIAAVAGLVISLIVVLIMKGQLKSVRRQNAANAYVKSGSMHLTQSGDYFMYRNVSKTPRQTNNSSSSRSSRNVGGGRF